MFKKEQKAASKEGKNMSGKSRATSHMITVERSANGNRQELFSSYTLFPKAVNPLIRTNPARPYDKTTGHFHSDSLTFKMTEQKENERMCIQKEAHLQWVRLSILFLYCLIQAISFS